MTPEYLAMVFLGALVGSATGYVITSLVLRWLDPPSP